MANTTQRSTGQKETNVFMRFDLAKESKKGSSSFAGLPAGAAGAITSFRLPAKEVAKPKCDTKRTGAKTLPSLDKKPVTTEEKMLRKKELNRRAAMRCRLRKTERVQKLEATVKSLQQRNQELTEEVSSLGAQLSSLEQTLVQHVASGCSAFRQNPVFILKTRGDATGW